MTTIRATCQSCGDVELSVVDLCVRVCLDDGDSSYVFRCPICTIPVVRPVEPQVVEVLVAAGVRMEAWNVPAEIFELHDGPPISHDDLLDFHLRLAEPGCVERAASSVAHS